MATYYFNDTGDRDWSYLIAYDNGGLKWYIYNDNVIGGYVFENTDNPLSYYPTEI